MRIVNMATVTVATTAGGTLLVSDAQMRAVSGAIAVVLNPVSDIYLVQPAAMGGSAADAVGTAANSPFLCPAGIPTVVSHRSGNLYGITASGTSVTRVGIGCEP